MKTKQATALAVLGGRTCAKDSSEGRHRARTETTKGGSLRLPAAGDGSRKGQSVRIRLAIGWKLAGPTGVRFGGTV